MILADFDGKITPEFRANRQPLRMRSMDDVIDQVKNAISAKHIYRRFGGGDVAFLLWRISSG